MDVFQLLLLHMDVQAAINLVDDDGLSIVHVATASGHTEILELLLKQGANARVKDANGRTPLDWAEDEFEDSCAAILKAHIETLPPLVEDDKVSKADLEKQAWLADLGVGKAAKMNIEKMVPEDCNKCGSLSEGMKMASLGEEDAGPSIFSQMLQTHSDATTKADKEVLMMKSETFQGSKDGLVFKTGEGGTGYYKDGTDEEPTSETVVTSLPPSAPAAALDATTTMYTEVDELD